MNMELGTSGLLNPLSCYLFWNMRSKLHNEEFSALGTIRGKGERLNPDNGHTCDLNFSAGCKGALLRPSVEVLLFTSKKTQQSLGFCIRLLLEDEAAGWGAITSPQCQTRLPTCIRCALP